MPQHKENYVASASLVEEQIKNLPAEQCREIAYSANSFLVSKQPMISHRAAAILCYGKYH